MALSPCGTLSAGAKRLSSFDECRAHTAQQEMVGLGRFELPTSPLSGVRSNQLSYRPLLMGPIARYGSRLKPAEPPTGGANRDRTGDLLLAKQALSQLSYGPEGQNSQTLMPPTLMRLRGQIESDRDKLLVEGRDAEAAAMMFSIGVDVSERE